MIEVNRLGGVEVRNEFRIMTQNEAEEIAYKWKYNDEYAFYNVDADEEDLLEFLDPEARGDSYFVVLSNREVIGFFNFFCSCAGTIDIGLAMKPNLVGKGVGLEFLKEGIEFARNEFEANTITLSVAKFNQRAITVYKRVGFKEVEYFMQDTNGSTFEFLKMIYQFNG